MIQIQTLEIAGFASALHGMRNPKNSWDRADSYYDAGADNFIDFTIGENDLELAMKLAKAGPVHGKFRRMIAVYADISAPMYWWSEFDTYKVGTVGNSCSKMHKLLSKPFEMSDFSFDKLPGYKREIELFIPAVDESKEIWCPCIHCFDYMISDQGRIRHGEKILSGSIMSDGYIRVNIKGKTYPVHRLVAECFLSNPDNKPVVNHKDGNKQNNKADNLEWCTVQANVIHSRKNNLQPNAVKVYKWKFTEEQRNEIKELAKTGMSIRKIAKMKDVSHTCIGDIIHDKYKYADRIDLFNECAKPLVDTLNEWRDSYFRTDDEQAKKQIWNAILACLPVSYNQKRTIMLNYEVLANIYKYRRNHKLDEWKEFIKWSLTLPYPELFTADAEINVDS